MEEETRAATVDGLRCLLLSWLKYKVKPRYGRSQSDRRPVYKGPHGTHHSSGVKGRGMLKGASVTGGWRGGDIMDPPSRTEWGCPGGGRTSSAKRRLNHSHFFSPVAGKRAPHLRLGPEAEKDTGIKIQVWVGVSGPGGLLHEGEPLSLGDRSPMCANRALCIRTKGIISPHHPPWPSVPPLNTRWCLALDLGKAGLPT